MTQPTERRFVMEPRLDAEVETLNTAISNEATARTNADALKVAKAGDTMTGALVLPGNPTTNLQAAPKQYVDSGDATEASARIAGDALKVAKAGDTMTGALILSGDPTLAMHAATKQYVDAADAAIQASITSTQETSRVYVKNGSTALTKGTPVYITGADGTNIIIGAAGNGSEATSSKTIGILQQDLAINAMGYVVTDGKLSNIDTSGATAAGDAVWLGPAGTKLYGLAAKPVAPAHMVYLGVVSRKNASTGEIQVKVQNGFELDELHNVLITSPTNGQALTYDNATGLWKNATPISALSGLSDVAINSGTLAGGQVIKYDSGTTKWVNGAAAGGVTASATAPNLATSAAGDAWFDTNDGTLYVCYIDVDATKQWVQVQANSALEASILSRLGALESTAVAAGQLSPNYVINGAFDIWQRGTGLVTATSSTTGFVSDRWQMWRAGYASGGATYKPSGPAGFESAARVQRDSGNTSTALVAFSQTIETNMSIPLAGKTVTLSFYAKAGANFSAASSILNPYIISGTGTNQNISSGFTGYSVVATTNNTLTTSWQRFSITGTIGTSATQIAVQFNYTPTGTAGTADYFEVTGVQLEVGNTATAFRRNAPSIQAELAACQRYYIPRGQTIEWGAANASPTTGYLISTYFFPTEMRVAPTITVYDGAGTANKVTRDNIGVGSTNGNTPTVDSVGTRHCRVLSTSGGSATGLFYSLEASAEL